MTRLNFEVLGHPEPAGSKRAVPVRRKNGGGWVNTGETRVIDANPLSAGWKNDVALAARAAMMRTHSGAGCVLPPTETLRAPGLALLEGPLGLAIIFTLMRPAGHFGSGRNSGVVKPSAPSYPCVRPDVDKLSRAVLDALTGVVYRDDAQVVEKFVTKRYGEPEMVKVTVWTL